MSDHSVVIEELRRELTLYLQSTDVESTLREKLGIRYGHHKPLEYRQQHAKWHYCLDRLKAEILTIQTLKEYEDLEFRIMAFSASLSHIKRMPSNGRSESL